MNKQEFLEASLDKLEQISGIDKTRWSKYFNGHTMNERNIYKLAQSLNMSYSEFLEALNSRRSSNGIAI